jgi:hypothetical protein
MKLNKFSGLILATAMISCSPGTPTEGRVTLDLESGTDFEINGEIFEFKASVLESAQEIAAIRNSIASFRNDTNVRPDLSTYPDEAMEQAITFYHATYSEIQKERDSAYADWLSTKEHNLETVQAELAEISRKETLYKEYLIEPSARLSQLNEQLVSLETQLRQINGDVVAKTNSLIIEKQLSIRQLNEGRSALRWQVSRWREGVDLANVKCETTSPSLTLDRTQIDGTCLYVVRPVEELASADYDSFLVQQLDAHVRLTEQIGEASYRVERNTGLKGEIAAATLALQNAEILAENQTGFSNRVMELERRRKEGVREQLANQISRAKEQQSQGIYPSEIGVHGDMQTQLNASSRLRSATESYLAVIYESVAEDTLIQRSPIASNGSFSDLDGGATILVAVLEAKLSLGFLSDTIGGAIVMVADDLTVDEEGRMSIEMDEDDFFGEGFILEGGFNSETALSRAYYEIDRHADEIGSL